MDYKKELKRIKKSIIAKNRSYSKKSSIVIEENFDETSYCLCTDSNHQFKVLYKTRFEAEKMAKFLYDEQGVSLMVYPCPYSCGWHLSKY